VIPVSASLRRRLDAYLAGGGSILATFESGLAPDQSDFALKALGVTKAGDGPRDQDGKLVRGRPFEKNQYAEYILPQGVMGKGLPNTEHVMYIKGLDVAAAPGSEVLSRMVRSYFDRVPHRFCSHRQTPSAGQPAGPAVVRRDRCVYLSHPVFTQYDYNAPRWCRQWLLNALDLLLTQPVLRHDGPSTLMALLNEQPRQQRRVVHLLHYLPERRGVRFDVLEDVIPVHDVHLSIRADRPIRRARLVPQETPLSFTEQDGRVNLTVKEIRGHQMVELQYRT
jgi:hypothetical protein